jgi:hypothetical protein
MPMEINGITKTRYKHWTDKGNPAFAKYLHTWGEAGTVTLKLKMTPKVKDQGVQCMFVGYALDHLSDTYRMWNPFTGGINESHDIIWLHRMYYSKPSKPGKEIAPIRFSVIDDDDNEPEPIPIQEAEEGEIIENEPYQGVYESDSDNEEDNESESEDEEPNVITTQSGRTVKPAMHLIEETRYVGRDELDSDIDIGLTQAEINYYEAMRDFPQGEFHPERWHVWELASVEDLPTQWNCMS